jgi:hypothetical protein
MEYTGGSGKTWLGTVMGETVTVFGGWRARAVNILPK